MTDLHVEVWGRAGPRIVLVHGSFGWGAETWSAQRPLADRYRLVVVDRRGFGGSPPVDRVDFAVDAADIADLLEPGDHLVGHSYGAVGCLLAAARRPDGPGSLVVIEPSAFGLAPDDPAVQRLAARLRALWRTSTDDDPTRFRAAFLQALGFSATPGARLKPVAEAAARASMTERFPGEARIPLDALADAPFPILVVSGAWDVAGTAARERGGAAFTAICDVLSARLGARRVAVAGAAHTPQRLGAPFNDLLDGWVREAAVAAR